MHSAYELFVGNVARIIYAVSMHHPNHTIYNPLIQGVTALRAIPLRENTWRAETRKRRKSTRLFRCGAVSPVGMLGRQAWKVCRKIER